jgi:hypothetical protein
LILLILLLNCAAKGPFMMSRGTRACCSTLAQVPGQELIGLKADSGHAAPVGIYLSASYTERFQTGIVQFLARPIRILRV